MPDSREVTINMIFDTKIAHIWCAKRTWEKKLVRKGWKPIRTDLNGVWFEVPLKALSVRSSLSVGAKRARSGRNLPQPPVK